MTTSSAQGIIDRIVAQMETIANIGVVHDRLRLAIGGKTAEDLFFSEIGGITRLRTWLVHLDAQPMTSTQADSGSRMSWNRRILAEGFSDFADEAATESDALALGESVMRVIWRDAQSTQLGGQILLAKPPALLKNEPRYFAGVVCSYVAVGMTVNTLEDF